MNKPVYLGLTILELSKVSRYEFWYEIYIYIYILYVYIIVYIKTNYIYKDIVEDVETRFDTSDYELDRALLEGKIK